MLNSNLLNLNLAPFYQNCRMVTHNGRVINLDDKVCLSADASLLESNWNALLASDQTKDRFVNFIGWSGVLLTSVLHVAALGFH